MASARFALLLMFSLLCVGSSANHRSLIPRSKPGRRFWNSVGASTVAGHEHRGTGIDMSEYISHGLGSLTTLVTKEYGLRDSESFYWGQDGNPMANLTAWTEGEQVRVLSMERFDNILQNARCSHNSIEFTFTEETQFDQLKDSWNWVNKDKHNYIILVTENAKCNVPDGDPTVKQPWHITAADFDDDNNTVNLEAEPKTWEEAFRTWKLKMNSKGILPPGNGTRLAKRGSVSIPLGGNFSGQELQLVDEDDLDVKLCCDPCYTTGTIDFDIEFDSSLDGHFTVGANNVGASITGVLSISGEFDGATATDTIFEWSPDGIAIAGLVDVGPTISVVASATLQPVEAEVWVSTGVDISIPDGSELSYDLGTGGHDLSGWTPVFTPLAPNMSSSISIGADAGTQLRLSLDLSAIGTGVSAGLMLAAPTLSIDAEAMTDTSGEVCDDPRAVAGVELDVGLGAYLDTYEGTSLLWVFGGETTQTILGTSTNLLSTCMTFASAPVLPSMWSFANVSIPASQTYMPSGSAWGLRASGSANVSYQATSSSYTASSSSYPTLSGSGSGRSMSAMPASTTSYTPSSSHVAQWSSSAYQGMSSAAASSDNMGSSSYVAEQSSIAASSSSYIVASSGSSGSSSFSA